MHTEIETPYGTYRIYIVDSQIDEILLRVKMRNGYSIWSSVSINDLPEDIKEAITSGEFLL